MSTNLPWPISVLETTSERWQRLAETLPEELMKMRPAPDQWSALECLHHLIETEGVFYVRLQVFLSGQPEFPGYDPDAPENQMGMQSTSARLVEEFVSRRLASLKILRQIKENDPRRTSRHAELGMVTLDQMLHEWAAHDFNHTIQAERALAQPFIRRSGPWRPFFSDIEIGT